MEKLPTCTRSRGAISFKRPFTSAPCFSSFGSRNARVSFVP
jgi:hypothetical protein